MKPFFVLTGSFVVALFATRLIAGSFDYVLAGNIAMCIMLWFTALGHFVYKKGMVLMMPAFIPFKSEVVFATGMLECLLGTALLFNSWRYIASWVLIVFFVLILPANVKAALRKIDYQKGDLTGPGVKYLWFRVPLQLLFIAWVWYFGVKGH